MRCAKCESDNDDVMRFCGHCGARLREEVTAEHAERRQLTVFFVDLVDSTSLSEALDPEQLRELYAKYQTACSDAIRRYEGHIAQYLGDGLLAYFGYPIAHEDDAQRAVRAGLDILARVEHVTLNGEKLRVRIGIHTGLVVVGDVGDDGHREQLALGETPNVAARIQSEAEPNTVLISEATRQLVAGHFDLHDRGTRKLKGISRATRVFRVLGKSRAASRFDAEAASGLAPFVGREHEVDAIRAGWARATSGSSVTLLLRGEAGIGKSRLLGVARDTARDRRHEVFEAECSPYHMNSPLHPIMEMLERRLGLQYETSSAGKLELLEQFLAGRGMPVDEALSHMAFLFSIPMDDRDTQSALPPAKRRQRTLEVLAETLLHAPGASPVLVLIEDLHWADPSTRDLVGTIIARQNGAPQLLVCTSRPKASPFPETAHPVRVIDVSALPQGDARALVSGVVGRKKLPEELTRQIIERTGGVPLFVEAVVRSVIDAGVLRELDDRYELTGPLPPGLIPATVHDSLMARIDRLGPDKSVAQLASTIGREFSFALLASVSDRAEEDLARALERAVELDLVSQAGVPPDAIYMFKHALVQDAAYESLLRKTRQEFHGKIAEALLRQDPDLLETSPEVLARHFEGAGRINEAITHWMKAGLQAQQRWAMAECVAYLRKAISLLETRPVDDVARTEQEMAAQLALGPALMAVQGWGSREVEAACSRARDLCVQAQNHHGLLQALWGLWTVRFVRGEMLPALEAAEPVLQMALATENPVLHIAARHAVGFTRYFLGDFVAAREHGEKALALFNLDQERALVGVFQLPSSVACGVLLSQSLWFMGYPEQAEQRHRDAWALVEALGIPPCTAYGLGVCIFLHYAKRDRRTIAEWAEQLFTLCNEEGFLLWSAQARIYRGWAQCMDGDTKTGLVEMQAGWDAYRLTESGIMGPQMWLMMAEGLRAAGRLDDALSALASGMKNVEDLHERAYEPELHRLEGEIALERGDASGGEASLRRAIEIAQHQQARTLELRAALPLARHWRDRGRGADARGLLQPLADWFQEGRDLEELVEARALLVGLPQ